MICIHLFVDTNNFYSYPSPPPPPPAMTCIIFAIIAFAQSGQNMICCYMIAVHLPTTIKIAWHMWSLHLTNLSCNNYRWQNLTCNHYIWKISHAILHLTNLISDYYIWDISPIMITTILLISHAVTISDKSCMWSLYLINLTQLITVSDKSHTDGHYISRLSNVIITLYKSHM